ncbi:ATP synthase subunit I [[Bacillus thuringiensis] serovar konkukian]|nr:ATP synthase subunit I [Bacillus thuringiensis]MED1299642.1 ATP synthase subunit I [Bacillus pacificus]OUB15566.1 ATP synthase subunit I [[Bacillus thuringiensis] serovar konkukian]
MIRMSLRTFRIQMYCLFLIFFIGWASTPFSRHFLGLGIGLLISKYCIWILGRRIEQLGENIIQRRKIASLGTLNRFAITILGTMLMYKMDYDMIIWTFVVGIMVGYLLIVINLAIYNMQDTPKSDSSN